MTIVPTTKTLSPVEELREAARLMRERAEKATPGPWVADISEIYSQFQGGSWVGETLQIGDAAQTEANSSYVASMHPAVALALADWLDKDDLYCWGPAEKAHALTVARAYLGGVR